MKNWRTLKSHSSNKKHIVKSQRPPFKWAGGKDRMFKKYQLSGFFPQSDPELFVDMFAGSACVGKWVKKNYPNCTVILNESCEEIINMYKQMQGNQYKWFEKEYSIHVKAYGSYSSVDDRKQYYYDLRNRYALNHTSMNSIEQAAALFYMLQTGFNGIWQTSKNFNNRYASPAGLMTWDPVGRLFNLESVKSFADFLDSCILMKGDFEKTQCFFGSGTWFYADPPYRDSFAKYKSSGNWNDKDQIRLINFLHAASKSGAACSESNRETMPVGWTSATSLSNSSISDGWFSDKFDNKWNCSYFENIRYTAGRHNHGVGSKSVEILIKNY